MSNILLFCKKIGNKINTMSLKNEVANTVISGILSAGISTNQAGKTDQRFIALLTPLEFDFVKLESEKEIIECTKENLLVRIEKANQIESLKSEYEKIDGFHLTQKMDVGKRGRKSAEIPAALSFD